MARFTLRARAQHDVVEVAKYLAEQKDEQLGVRFMDAVDNSSRTLVDNPNAGVVCGFNKPSTKRLRRWPVKGFENWLIFYLPKRNGIEVVRVIHRARNISRIFNA